MTLSQRVSGIIMPRLDGEHWANQAYRDNTYRLLDLGIRSFGVFKGEYEQTVAMIEDLQRRSGGQLLFGADFEFGLPMRITNRGISMPRAMALGRCQTTITERVAQAIAQEMRAMGILWNWAPVADINSNPDNPVINTRSFAEQPDTVSMHVKAWIAGTKKGHVLSCVKHAPGHGDTATDSHLSLPTIKISAEKAVRREFAPFRAGIDAGAESIMVGHLLVPFLDARKPASLSQVVVTGLIRDSWQYNGVIITDALDMGAITTQYTADKAAVLAFRAGCDILVMPQDTEAAIKALVRAIQRDALTEARLVASEERIAAMRSLLPNNSPVPIINENDHAALALEAAQQAVVTYDADSVLPISRYRHVAAFAVVDNHQPEQATQWLNFLSQATEMNIDCGFIDASVQDAEIKDLLKGIADAEIVVFGFFLRGSGETSTVASAEKYASIVHQLSAGRPSVVVACGSPYGIGAMKATATIYTFSDTTPSVAASVFRLTKA